MDSLWRRAGRARLPAVTTDTDGDIMIRSTLPGISRLAIAAVLALLAGAVSAVTVHTWVDADGVRHFADAPPTAEGGVASSEISVDGGEGSVSEDLDYYSITNQWQRLRAEREAEEALDLQRGRGDGAQPPAPPPMQDDVPRSVFYPSYYYGLPPRGGPMYPWPADVSGPPSPRNAFVNKPPPVWPRER
jgi:hypothetical protein